MLPAPCSERWKPLRAGIIDMFYYDAEAARRARINQLTEELAQVGALIDEAGEALTQLGRRRDRLAAEHRAGPADALVREAHTVAAADRRRRAELREQHDKAVEACARRQRELDEAVARVGEFAQDVGLPADPGALAAVKSGVDAYRLALAGLWPAAEAWRTADRVAGVDDDSRAQCLGLLATFDMDVVMTSEREWDATPRSPGSPSASLCDRTASTPSWSRHGGGTGGNAARPAGLRRDAGVVPCGGTADGADAPSASLP